jgi:hypothetical protein
MHEGSLPDTAGESPEDRKQQALDYLDTIKQVGGVDADLMSQLYGRINADEDVTEEDYKQYKGLADDLHTNIKEGQKQIRKGTLNNYAKFINQSINDKFGPGPSGSVQRFSMGGSGDYDFTVSSSSGKQSWEPKRAVDTLVRLKAYQEKTGTSMGFITQNEGFSLLNDVFIAKHTDYANNKGGWKLDGKGGILNQKDKVTISGVTEIVDIHGNKYAYGSNKGELWKYDAEYGDVWRKIKSNSTLAGGKKVDMSVYNINQDGTIKPDALQNWGLNEFAKYKYID